MPSERTVEFNPIYITLFENRRHALPSGELNIVEGLALLEDITQRFSGHIKCLRKLRIPYNLKEYRAEEIDGFTAVRYDKQGKVISYTIYPAIVGLSDRSYILHMIEKGHSLYYIRQKLLEEQEEERIYTDENLLDLPIREFTEEEATILMKYKMETGNEPA